MRKELIALPLFGLLSTSAAAQDLMLSCEFRSVHKEIDVRKELSTTYFSIHIDEARSSAVIDDTPPRRAKIGPTTFTFAFSGTMLATINRVNGTLSIAEPERPPRFRGTCKPAQGRKF